jgi:hypothetical protein
LRRASFQINKNSLAENVGSFVTMTIRIVCHKYCMSSHILTLFSFHFFKLNEKLFYPLSTLHQSKPVHLPENN